MHATSLTLRLSGFHDPTSRCALDLADLPPQGWDFEYLQLEPDRRGLPIFRPVVPVRIAASNLSPIFALVDSGCEHCLAASWLAHELGIDLRDATDTLELGIGGRTVTARFVEVEIQLHQDETSNEFVTWRAEVGFIEPWDAQFYIILGQTGFFDTFAVTMSRRLLTVVIEDPEEFHKRRLQI